MCEVAMTTTLRVDGMTCGHCVAAVTEELTKLEGVTDVQVDLDDGVVTVESSQMLDVDDATAAIVEAGYELLSIG